MSRFSLKEFLTFVEKDTPSPEEVFEIFGFFSNPKKVAALQSKNAELRTQRDKLKATRDQPAVSRSQNAMDRTAEREWVDDKLKSTDPRKMYTNKKMWRDAVDQLGAKAAENTSMFAKDKDGRLIAKWNDDKREGWIEVR